MTIDLTTSGIIARIAAAKDAIWEKATAADRLNAWIAAIEADESLFGTVEDAVEDAASHAAWLATSAAAKDIIWEKAAVEDRLIAWNATKD